MIREVRVFCYCDECGVNFSVKMDCADTNTWSVYDHVENAILGSLDYQGNVYGFSSIQNKKHLCAMCTKIYDNEELENK